MTDMTITTSIALMKGNMICSMKETGCQLDFLGE